MHTLWSSNTPSSLPHATPHPPDKAASFPFQLGAAQRPQEPAAKAALVCMSKLPQLSGHVESYSFALHEKLKSCPDHVEFRGPGCIIQNSCELCSLAPALWPGQGTCEGESQSLCCSLRETVPVPEAQGFPSSLSSPRCPGPYGDGQPSTAILFSLPMPPRPAETSALPSCHPPHQQAAQVQALPSALLSTPGASLGA